MIPYTENNINDEVINYIKEEEKEELITTEENKSIVLPSQIATEDSDSNNSENSDSDNENPTKRRKLSEEERLKRW